MTWFLGALALSLMLPMFIHQRRTLILASPFQPISMLFPSWAKKTSKRSKAALEAATKLLR